MGEAILDLYTSIVPNRQQQLFCKDAFHAFFHYGMTTFTEKEWGDGKTPVETFDPGDQDTDEWVRTVKDAGAKGCILTCKHHDGFCLWPTKTTEYSIKNSPYKNGQGDVVREVAESCKKYGMKFGVYLSPWDRNSEYYGTPKYNDFYIEQLKELLTGYGDLFCVWLDGACGSYMDGKEKQVYDFDRIYATVREYQPDCAISNCGPDIRWVGNEGGYARKSEWNVVPKFSFNLQTIADNSQQEADSKFRKKGADVISSDLGSREFLSNYNEFIWYPAEVDVSIRPGWFYHKKEDRKVRSLSNLLTIYYNSVGGNSLLLLNVPPNREGRLAPGDIQRLHELGEEIRKGTAEKIKVKAFSAPPAKEEMSFQPCLNRSGTYSPAYEAGEYEFKLKFAAPARIDKVLIEEDTDFSQRIESFDVYARKDGREVRVYSGTTVGFRRFAVFKRPVEADGLRLVITSCRKEPYLKNFCVYAAGGKLPKPAWYAPLIQMGHKINYMLFVAMENIKNK